MDVEERKTIGNRIRQLREDLGWRQEDLADRVGVKKVTVQRWETGKTSISDVHRRSLSRVLRTSVAMLGGEDVGLPASRDDVNMAAVMRVFLIHMNTAFTEIGYTVALTHMLLTTLHGQTKRMQARLDEWLQRQPDTPETAELAAILWPKEEETEENFAEIALKEALAHFRRPSSSKDEKAG